MQDDPSQCHIAVPQTTHESTDVVQHVVLHESALLQVLPHLQQWTSDREECMVVTNVEDDEMTKK